MLEVNDIFVQFHCLSSYRNNLYQNDRFPCIHLLQSNDLLPTIQLDEGERLVPKQSTDIRVCLRQIQPQTSFCAKPSFQVHPESKEIEFLLWYRFIKTRFI